MELQAKVIQLLPVQSGTSKSGSAWQKREVIVETSGQYPKKVALTFFGDKFIQLAAPLSIGETCAFHIDIESNEYNGRWFTQVKCFKITPFTPEPADPYAQYNQPAAPPQQAQTYTPPASYGQPPQYAQPAPPQQPGLFSPQPPSSDEEDLPF